MDEERLAALRKTLRGKRARFTEEYIKDFNATAAAIRAGIPEAGAAVQAHRFLHERAVLDYKEALIEAEAEIIGVNKESLIKKSEDIFRRCMVAEPVMEFDHEEKCMKPTGEYVFDSRGAAKALELQAKLTGNLTERREVEGEAFTITLHRAEGDDGGRS